MLQLQTIHRDQRLNHVAGSQLTLPLVVLRHLQEGQAVKPELIEQAIRDL